MNELVIGYESALDFWRAARVATLSSMEEINGRVIGAGVPSTIQQAKRILSDMGSDGPLHVVVPDSSQRPRCKRMEGHVYRGPLGRRLLHDTGDALVCRPPAMFVQLAGSLDEIDLALVAGELCGTYGLSTNGLESCVYDLEPLTSVVELREYARAAQAVGTRGAARAIAALEFVVDGAASQRETEIAILMLLSRRKGGANLPGFVVNATLPLAAELQRLVGSSSLSPDFMWEHARLVVEYDSNEFHLTALQKDRDEARRQVLERLGFTVKSLTNDVLRDNVRLNAFVEDLEQKLDPKRRPPSASMTKVREALRERLFGVESDRALHAERKAHG